MGHKLEEWTVKVAEMIRDLAGRDVTTEVQSVGVLPAIAQHASRFPREETVVAGVGSQYVDLPAGWVNGISSLIEVECPGGQNPPRILDACRYRLVRKPADPTVKQILLDSAATTGQNVWLTFTTTWPAPTNDADDDLLDDLAYEGVSALAAALVCEMLAAEASRARGASLPTNYVNGTDRARDLREAAKEYRQQYKDSTSAFWGVV